MSTQTLDKPMETTQLTTRQDIQLGKGGIELRTLGELWRFAQYVSAAGMAPSSYNKRNSPEADPAKIMIGIQAGMELGLAPMQALKGIYVVNGMPTIWGDAALALVRRSGLLEVFEETVENPGTRDEFAQCKVQRKGESGYVIRTFSVQEMQLAELDKKRGPWQYYPGRMRQMRARSYALRDAFADVLFGVYITEEALDIPNFGSDDLQLGPDVDVTQAPAQDTPERESEPASKSASLASKLKAQAPEASPEPESEAPPQATKDDAPKGEVEPWDENPSEPTQEATLSTDDLAEKLEALGFKRDGQAGFAAFILQRDVTSLEDLSASEQEALLNEARVVAKNESDEAAS